MPIKIYVRSEEDLAGRLESADLELVCVLLEALAVRPQPVSEPILALILRRLKDAHPGSPLETSALKALSAHGHPETLLPWFAGRTDLAVLLPLASAFRRLEPARRWQLLSGWLGGPEDPRSRLTAELLVGCEPGPAEAVAVAVRCEAPAPPFEAAPSAWLEALRGPYRERARRLLTPAALADRFEELEVPDKLWLLAAGLEPRREWLHPEQAPAVLCQLLTALAAPAWAGEHAHPEVRAVALRGCADADERWDSESEPDVLAVLAGRLTERLGQALRSPHWQVRAAAARRAAELGRVEILREVAREAGPAQAAAVNALLWLGDDEWLGGLLPGC